MTEEPGPPGPGQDDPEGAACDDWVRTTVPALLDRMRVDRAVAMVTGLSRATAARLVESGRVWVDGRETTVGGSPLAAGSLLEIDVPPEPAGLGPEPGVVFAVVYEDDSLVVVDKPAGLVVHPGAGNPAGTLAGGLLARYPDLADLVAAGICDPLRPGIVHRLDRGTSGLLVVARTGDAYRSLVGQLAARTMSRRYLALVEGLLPDDRGLVDAPIGRSVRSPTRMAVSAQGREARTAYEVLERLDGDRPRSLLRLSLETGRTHQIRVHLAAIGHPVVGDDRYRASGGRGARSASRHDHPDGLSPGRLFLHAYELALEHPSTGDRMSWRAPVPEDLISALGRPIELPDPETG